MLIFDKATYLSLLFKSILAERLSNSLWGSDVLLVLKLINIVLILFYKFIEFIIYYTHFLITSFALYKKDMIFLISFSKFSDVLQTFTFTRAIGNLWSIESRVNALSPLPCVDFHGNMPLLKALKVNSRPS